LSLAIVFAGVRRLLGVVGTMIGGIDRSFGKNR